MLRDRRRYLALTFLVLVTLFRFHRLGTWEDKFQVQIGFIYQLKDGDRSHPVEYLHAAAKKQFADLLSRQSTTVEEATKKYERKYARKPPPGFEKWFAFAKKHSSLIVDEYDEMMKSLEPFRKIAPKDVVRLIERADSPEQTRKYMKKCSLVQGELRDCGAWAGVMSHSWGLKEALKGIPDMTFIANYRDEPAVLASQPTTDFNSTEQFKWSNDPVWPQVKEACEKLGKYGLPKFSMASPHLDFIANTTQQTDLCSHPDFGSLHGYLDSGTKSLHINHTITILSRAVPYPYGDIIFPAPSYSWAEFSYSAWRDRSWKRKANALYWVGSNTGSYTHDESWRNHHRQRLVLLGNGASTTGVNGRERNFTYLKKAEGDDSWIPYTSTNFNRSLYHVAISRVGSCDEPSCEQQLKAFPPPSKPAPASEPYHYKYVFDIDGNSLSGRFYRLLASNSAVLKTTMFKEWHDERLVPWLHYIPVSLGFEELPELVRFLTTTDEGLEIGRWVAKEGKEWHDRVLREVDRGVYFYRLLVEMAWLQDLKRVPDA
ncbi:uncharacterized protein RAG0_01537 [Rhynchosporium agropyri]|uniref:Glycosyl transferase CAP10 domain-containing protein n=1 Tax=Rhynchosporium agropyri TaxID=914238 RepID=A0A1E1JXL1_9HELO|nr:uncharacterized protein RAG0_01537 [Rhynchosporium agropyri]